MLGAGVPESGIVEVDGAWIGWEGGGEGWTGTAVSVYSKALLKDFREKNFIRFFKRSTYFSKR